MEILTLLVQEKKIHSTVFLGVKSGKDEKLSRQTAENSGQTSWSNRGVPVVSLLLLG